MAVCAACGQENPEGARFCNACGAPLAGAQSAAREERKVVTVFFADLVGFTGRAEQLDPEDVRAMLSPYYARLRSEIERFGGTVEKFIGDAVMAVFGAPVAHEDDPERAVRAALAVREAVQEMNEGDPALDLHVRIAVNTGEAVVALDARPSEGEGMVAGDVVNTAARLQAAAPVDGILVGDTTYRATERAIEYVESEPVQAKGKSEPIPVWEAVAARARFGVDVSQRGGAALVGRRDELDLLLDALARAERERTPQLLTLVGVPGIGKSRLVWELARTVDEDPELVVFWRQGRSLPYGEGIAFWAVTEMIKAQAGILETDSAEVAEEKLRATVADLLPDPTEARWVETHLRRLVGVAGQEEAGGDRRDEAFSAWRRFFEALAEHRPAVLVFEDLHWADDNLLDFVDYLVDWATNSPLLVIGTARPELLERRAGWGGGKPNAATVSLSPLSEEETARLLASLFEQAVMPAELQTALLARAGGNPLYAEEYARLVAERGFTVTEESPLPETVQGIVAARLDGLSAEEKALIQDAAVVGKVFWSGALASMNGLQRWTVEEMLHGLERKEFVRRDRRSSVATETEYAFRHVLVREVAYGQVPRSLRAEKHRRAAEWIETLGADREDRAEMLAHHYSSALQFARAAGQPLDGLAERAREVLRESGDRAYALNAFGAASGFYAEAIDLWPDARAGRGELLFRYARSLFLWNSADVVGVLEEAVELLLDAGSSDIAAEAEVTLGLVHWFNSERTQAAPHFAKATELIESAEPSHSKTFVLSELARFAMLGDEDARAVDLARRALALVDELGIDQFRAPTLNALGVARVKLGELEGLNDLERALELTVDSPSPERVRAFVNLASTLGELGELERSIALHEEGLGEAGRAGTPEMVRWLKAECIWDEYLTGRWVEAERHADEFIVEVDAGHPHYMEAAARHVRALIRLAHGDGADAHAESERVLATARAAQDAQVLFPSLAFHAHMLMAVGRREEALEIVDELLEQLRAKTTALLSYWTLFLAVVLVATGREADFERAAANPLISTRWLEAARAFAAGRFGEASGMLAEIGAVADEAFLRLRGAEALVERGRRAEADVQLQQALAFYRSVGAKAYVREAEQLLAASA
ncbi:MAG TPA: adenylate/guanylate cyclase domain-containing protein [Gaiellaceae bacterium]|nr:adenylate/guanylate cyclase domain-containing protein [Gaiellaceae bacterium]